MGREPGGGGLCVDLLRIYERNSLTGALSPLSICPDAFQCAGGSLAVKSQKAGKGWVPLRPEVARSVLLLYLNCSAWAFLGPT